MPLKLNIGLTKKIGQPNYGSLGASCHVEIELEQSLLEHDLDGFHERIKRVFTACRRAVSEELTQQQEQGRGAHSNSLGCEPPTDANGQDTHSTNGSIQRDRIRRATAAQVRALNAIASRNGLDLTSLANDQYGLHVDELSLTQASQLIDELLRMANGERVASEHT